MSIRVIIIFLKLFEVKLLSFVMFLTQQHKITIILNFVELIDTIGHVGKQTLFLWCDVILFPFV